MAESINYTPIGFVENSFNDRADPDVIAATESRVHIDASLAEGLKGLEAGQRIIVVFHCHRSKDVILVRHPRGDTTRPKRGLFALRTADRPNPIGITEVDLLSIDGTTLTVRGLDAINGTPVLDIKPA
jgi:tRNA-Thr(GGU) m(6)t(6)A37 methyltransferase TsaA